MRYIDTVKFHTTEFGLVHPHFFLIINSQSVIHLLCHPVYMFMDIYLVASITL